VGALALQVAGLKSSLHGAIDSRKQLKARSFSGPKQAAQITGFTRPLSTFCARATGALVVDKCAAAR
jgi:hypothetical protein